MSQLKTMNWLMVRFSGAVGRVRYWSFSGVGLRSSEVFGLLKHGMGDSYKQVTHRWEKLVSVRQFAEGLVFRFEGRSIPTMLPLKSFTFNERAAIEQSLSRLRIQIEK